MSFEYQSLLEVLITSFGNRHFVSRKAADKLRTLGIVVSLGMGKDVFTPHFVPSPITKEVNTYDINILRIIQDLGLPFGAERPLLIVENGCNRGGKDDSCRLGIAVGLAIDRAELLNGVVRVPSYAIHDIADHPEENDGASNVVIGDENETKNTIKE